jgi:hypothetical protein
MLSKLKEKNTLTPSLTRARFRRTKKTFYTRHASLCFIRLTISSSCTLTLSNLSTLYFFSTPLRNICLLFAMLLQVKTSFQTHPATGFKNRPSSWIFQVATTPANPKKESGQRSARLAAPERSPSSYLPLFFCFFLP